MKWNDETLGELLRSLPAAPEHLVARAKDLPMHVEGDFNGSDHQEDAGWDSDPALDDPLGFENDGPADEFEPSSGDDDIGSPPEEI